VPKAAWLLEKMGSGWPEQLGLHPADGAEAEWFAWWTACALRAGERGARSEDRAAAALGALRGAGVLAPAKLAASPQMAAAILAGAGLREPEVAAARLARASAALETRFEGSLVRLAAGAPSLEELGGRLVSLAPGLGPGSALRFLRPLRDRLSAADEAPLDPAAHAAAVHLGWLDEHDDLETAPGMLRRRLEDEADAPPLPRVEEALERLGRAACRRSLTARCPLEEACPARR